MEQSLSGSKGIANRPQKDGSKIELQNAAIKDKNNLQNCVGNITSLT